MNLSGSELHTKSNTVPLNSDISGDNLYYAGSHEPVPATSHACGKAIIIGEHAVVYGARAIAVPLFSKAMNIHITPDFNHKADRPIHMSFGGKPVSDRLIATVEDAFKLLGARPFPLTIEGHSLLPIGAGLGSSASICVALLRALSESLGISITKADLARMANSLEARFHGNPSGLDTAVVAFEEPIIFSKLPKPKAETLTGIRAPEGLGQSWHFALIDSGVRSSTIAMVKIAEPFFNGPQGEKALERFDDLTDEVIIGLKEGDSKQVAAAMTEAGILLERAGVMGESLRAIEEAALRTGILAIKPTGAGGGGCMIALLDPNSHLENLNQLRQTFGSQKVYEVTLP